MALFNGVLAELIKGSSTGGENAVLTGTSTVAPGDNVPGKGLIHAVLAVHVTGISGTLSVGVVSNIAGATFVVIGATGIATNGINFIGQSTASPISLPRISGVNFESAEDGTGFSATVVAFGEY